MRLKRILSILLAVAMVAVMTVGVCAAEPASTAADKSGIQIVRTASDDATKKDETVYVMLDGDGTVQRIIVSDWLENVTGLDEIADTSSLTDVENVKSDETYTTGANGAMTWEAKGGDIYYKGNASAALPVDVTVSYELDGKAVTAAELSGKSGCVTMRFDYKNNEKRTVSIDGEDQDVYVPFLMATGLLLDTDKFSNVEITGGTGKVISDANRIAVLGVALPGMQESLGVDAEDLELPGTVEITADVEDFSLMTSMTVAMPISMDGLELEGVDSEASLKDQLSELTDGMDALLDGSGQLYDGLETLLEKSGDLIDGVDALASGAKTLKSGAATLSTNMAKLDTSAVQLAAGAGTLLDAARQLSGGADDLAAGADSLKSGADQVSAGASRLNTGLGNLSSKSGELNGGAKQVFETLLSTAKTQLEAAGLSDVPDLTIENYDTVLAGLSGQLDAETVRQMAYNQALQQVTATVEASESAIRAGVEAEKPTIYAAVLAEAPGMPEAFAAAGLDVTYENYLALIAAGAIPEEAQAQIDAVVAQQIDSLVAQKKQELINQNMASEAVQNGIAQAVAKAQAGQNSIEALRAQLNKYNEFYEGVLAYTAGVDEAAAGAQTLTGGAGTLAGGAGSLLTGSRTLAEKLGEFTSGSDSLATNMNTMSGAISQLDAGAAQVLGGISQLQSGINQLKSGSGALVDGVTQLRDGSGELKDGIEKLNDEGIQKIVDLFDGNLGTLVTRLRALADVAGDYNNYSGLSDDMTGTVKFIYKTAAIGE